MPYMMGLTAEDVEKIKDRFRSEIPRPYTILSPKLKTLIATLNLPKDRETRLLEKISRIPKL